MSSEIQGSSSRVTKRGTEVRRPSLDALGSQIVSLKIGVKAKPYTIHEKLLISCSPYFRKAFTGDFREARDRGIALDDVTERTFEVFVQWLYSQKMVRPDAVRDTHRIKVSQMVRVGSKECHHIKTPGCSKCSRLRSIMLGDFDEKTMGVANDSTVVKQTYMRGRFEAFDYTNKNFWNWDDLLDVFILADKYDVPHLRTDAIKQWQYQTVKFECHCRMSTVVRAYENLSPSSSLCRLISETWAHRWKPNSKDENDMRTRAPPEFLAEVLLIKAKSPSNPRPSYITNPCSFHDHEEDGEAADCGTLLPGKKSPKRPRDSTDSSSSPTWASLR